MGFDVEGDVVNFFCRWPYEPLDDDFTVISNSFPLKRFRAAIHLLEKKKKAKVRGAKFGELRLKITAVGYIELDVDDSQRVYPNRLCFPIEASPRDLLPPNKYSQKRGALSL